MKYLLLLSVIIITAGCSRSYIKINKPEGGELLPMYGKTPAREFYLNKTIGDSILLKWEADINGSFPNSSVTVTGEFIFAADLSGRVYCFNSTTGKTAGMVKPGGSVYSSPLINESVLIFAASDDDEDKSVLYYYDFINGKMLNEVELEGKVLTEMILTDDGVILLTERGIVYNFNFHGYQNWKSELNTMLHSSPSLNKNILVFGNDEGEIIGMNAESGEVLYRKKLEGPFFSGTCIEDDVVYAGNNDGTLYALDLSSGETKWKFNTGSRILMTPVFNEQSVIIGNLNGNLFSLTKDGKLNWKIKVDGVFNTAPLLTDNFIIQPDLFEIYHLIDPATGKIVDNLELEGRAKLTPVIVNNLLFIGYDNGILRAYEFIK